MKKKKTNIYLEYFKSPNTILTQSQKRLVVIFMMFAGLFVIRTIGGMNVVYFYALTGMLTIATVVAFWLTEEVDTEWEQPLLLEHMPPHDAESTVPELENVK